MGKEKDRDKRIFKYFQKIYDNGYKDRVNRAEEVLDQLLMAQKMIRNDNLSLAKNYIDNAIKKCRADL